MSAIVKASSAAIATSATLPKLAANAAALSELVEVLPLVTPADEQTAVGVLSAIKELVAEAEDERKALVKPYKSESDKIDAAFRGPRKILETVERRLRMRLAEAAENRERERRAALAAAAEAARAGQAEAANAAIVKASEAAAPAPEGVSFRWAWAVEVEDAAAVPRAFLAVDVGALERHAAAAGTSEPVPVPGVRFVRKATTVRRG